MGIVDDKGRVIGKDGKLLGFVDKDGKIIGTNGKIIGKAGTSRRLAYDKTASL